MKPQVGITLIALIFLGVFVIYSNLPERAEDQVNASSEGELQANTNVILGNMIVDQDSGQSANREIPANIDIKSTSGLNEELRGIVEGFNVIAEELQSLEETPTGPAQ